MEIINNVPSDGEQIDMQNKLNDVASRYFLSDIYAFGSRADDALALARGETPASLHPGSDIDIGVRVRPSASLGARRRTELMIELEDLFEVRRVDLVFLNETDPFIALDVIRGHLLYTEDRDSQAQYELYVLRRAGDMLPLKIERMEMILEREAP